MTGWINCKGQLTSKMSRAVSEGECDMETSPADPATGSPLSIWGTRGRGMRTETVRGRGKGRGRGRGRGRRMERGRGRRERGNGRGRGRERGRGSWRNSRHGRQAAGADTIGKSS